ncbi:MAG: DUF1214 domain-containing protein [Gammaproteobacteria bacterium]
MTVEIGWPYWSAAAHVEAGRTEDARVLDLGAWKQFADALGQLPSLLPPEVVNLGPVDQAELIRNVLQMFHFGLERTMGSNDPYRPVFSRPWAAHLFDWGGANPDSVYRTITLRDDLNYRIHGRFGNAPFIGFDFTKPGGAGGNLLAADFHPGNDGRFEIFLGKARQSGTWYEMVPGTNGILVREFFDDWDAARTSQLEIECLDAPPGPWPIVNADRVERQLTALSQWLAASVRFWAMMHMENQKHRNGFKPAPTRPESPLPYVYNGGWDLGADECLVMEMSLPPAPRYWGLQTISALYASQDYAHRQVSLTRAQSVPDADGRVRIVLAHRDPGVANWLDTSGMRQGGMLFRIGQPAEPAISTHRLADTAQDWFAAVGKEGQAGAPKPRSELIPAPRCSVVPLAQLDRVLPAGTRRVSAQQRAAALAQRAAQVNRLIRS